MTELAYLESDQFFPDGRLRLANAPLLIGRASDCDIVINIAQISRNHARIFRHDDEYCIEDLGSVNGTFVNQTPVKGRQRLHDGDRITLGDVTMFYREDLTSRIRLTDDFDTDASLTFAVPIRDLAALSREKSSEVKRDPAQMMQIIFNAAKTLLGFQDLHEVLAGVMDLVFEYLQPDRGFLMLANPQTGDLEPHIVKYSGSAKEEEINFSRTIVNQVFTEGISILTTDAMKDSRFSEHASIVMHQIRSCMCVPLWDEQKIIGIIYVDTRFTRNYFQQRDLDLISTIAIISAIAIERFRLNQAINREKRIREHLERYHSPHVVSRIIDFERTGSLRTEEKEITVLFADLVGFTSMSEKLPPADVALILNHFFNYMTEIIFTNEGTLDKFIGDSVMAVFGAPLPHEDHAVRAVKAAVEMFQSLKKINDSEELPTPLAMRIGINSGRAVAGDIGSMKRMEYTVLGSTVNIASRIEAEVAHSGEIIIGETTHHLIGDKWDTIPLGHVPLRGLSLPCFLYRVEIPPPEDTAPTDP
ncbi:MAG: FHA domain-containing protein [Acidobacteria bacterium]|nr:FHA domain-containing protein [Acidobacteriota bacterium]